MRMQWLDLFRGVAALMVVFYHFHAAFGLPRLDAGFLAVDLFFVLSGIVLGLRYTPKIEAGMSFGQFAYHRLRRLYPMAVIVTLLVLVMNAIGAPAGQFAYSSPAGWINTLTLFPMPARFGYHEAFPPDAPMYTLWAELAANAVWFGALRLGRRATAALFALSALGFAALAIHYGSFGIGWWPGSAALGIVLVRALAWFGVGFYIAVWRVKLALPRLPLLVALVALCAVFRYGGRGEVLLSLAIVATGIALLVSLMTSEPSNPTLARVCRWVGQLSYPLYLIHVPSDRIALWLVGMGMPSAVTHVLVIGVAGIAAAAASEFVVRRLPQNIGLGQAGAAARPGA